VALSGQGAEGDLVMAGEALAVAHVLPSFGLGGQERVALRLAVEQLRTGHRPLAVSLAAPPEGMMAGEFRRAGIEALSVPKLGRGLDPRVTPRLARLFEQRGVDVVHAHNPQSLIYGAPAGKAARAAVVYTCHGESVNTPGRLWLTRLASLYLDAYVGVSPKIAARARRFNECVDEKLHVIENGVDLGAFGPDAEARQAVRDELGIPQAAWVVGTVGRLAPEKNPGLLLRAMAPMLGAQARLVYLGDGPEMRGLRGQAVRHPAGRFVHLVGMRPDVHRVLAAYDVFALSSRTEGLPLALLEAMAAGLPVVATAVGGVPDVVRHGTSALLVRSDDEEALRHALARLREDRTLAMAMGQCARQRSADYSAKAMNRRYIDLYRACRQNPLPLT
jgi:glycosyltransferase involved in cell wall biosynthesis